MRFKIVHSTGWGKVARSKRGRVAVKNWRRRRCFCDTRCPPDPGLVSMNDSSRILIVEDKARGR